MESGGTPLRRPRTSQHVSLNSKHRPQILPTRAFAHLLDHPLLQLHLHPLLTSLSPLTTAIRDATGLSFYGASLLTSLPVVAMGAGAFGAAVAPLVAGIVRDWSGGFVAAWIMLTGCIAAMMAVTLLFSPRSYSRWL
ncbi:cyanate permease [Paraburkholderia sp. Clong3]